MVDSVRQGPIQINTVHGKPITVYGRTLTPVARVIAGGSHIGSVGEKNLSGRGWAVQIVRPIQVIEEQNGETRTLSIPNVTREILVKMTIVGIVVMMASLLTMLLVQVKRND